ncbi:dTDP-4-amino-4,6-dideoxygalactose transaminase [Ancylobacter vacuolatus]|uniref:dTDP-4-amino-4,6-dideoxygalactose transaminase n=1 Tax=Ancylobacter vacuolatus TaxID=223389 RepID=A0ABU0DG64_9HYPH|nr:dTDP-4-amino-4,6-dideoxygalactose transaminase [Ancylobacter vacuolatus]
MVLSFIYIASVKRNALTVATPVFADCCADGWQMGPEDMAPLITSRTKAIVPVPLYGAVCDMDDHGDRREARPEGD